MKSTRVIQVTICQMTSCNCSEIDQCCMNRINSNILYTKKKIVPKFKHKNDKNGNIANVDNLQKTRMVMLKLGMSVR